MGVVIRHSPGPNSVFARCCEINAETSFGFLTNCRSPLETWLIRPRHTAWPDPCSVSSSHSLTTKECTQDSPESESSVPSRGQFRRTIAVRPYQADVRRTVSWGVCWTVFCEACEIEESVMRACSDCSGKSAIRRTADRRGQRAWYEVRRLEQVSQRRQPRASPRQTSLQSQSLLRPVVEQS